MSCVPTQEDPRLKIPVQMRRRASLDPADLGPMPVSLFWDHVSRGQIAWVEKAYFRKELLIAGPKEAEHDLICLVQM